MKAMIQRGYGSPDLLRLEEVDQPAPGAGEVLIKVHAASVNSWDWERLLGTPFANRVMYGLTKPRRDSRILGADVAGRVKAVGAGAVGFGPGADVFGDLSDAGWGAFAEYVRAPENVLTQKPPSLTYEQAAAVPQAAVLALSGLMKGGIAAGQRVLINGAGGGVGTFAIQLAKWHGAHVTGIDVGEKMETMRSAGADELIDHTSEDFSKLSSRYDLILDVAAHRSPLVYSKWLAPGGSYVVVGGSTGRILQTVLLRPWLSWTTDKKVGLLIHRPNEGLQGIAELLESGAIAPVIDRVFPLEQTSEALRYFGQGHAKGKVVIRV